MSKERKRVAKERVKANAEKGGRGGSDWFKLPEGVGRWNPDKEGRFSIDVLPYEVKSPHHPDDIEQECLWYKLPFMVHHSVGASNDSVVCPRSLNKPCPICEEKDRLYKDDSEGNEDVIKALKPQKFVAYNIKSLEEEGRVDVMCLSRGKFAKCLEGELKDPDNDEHLAFFDVNKDGRTLRVRFAEASFEGKKYIEATKIDFRPREEMDEDKVLNSTVCLEEALILMDYEDLKTMFLQEDEEKGKKDKGFDELKDEDEDKDEKKKPSKDEDGDDDEKPSKSKSKDEDEDGDDDEKPSKGKKCAACGGTGKSSSGKTCAACEGTGKVEDKPSKSKSKDEDEDGDDDEKPSKSKSKDEKKGKDSPTCPVKGGKFGQVDQHDECDDCPHWTKCEEASE